MRLLRFTLCLYCEISSYSNRISLAFTFIFNFLIITIKFTRIQLCKTSKLWDNNAFVEDKQENLFGGCSYGDFGSSLPQLLKSFYFCAPPIQAFFFLCLYMTKIITIISFGPRSTATRILAVSVVFCSETYNWVPPPC